MSPIFAFSALASVFAVLILIMAAELRGSAGLRRLLASHSQKGALAVAGVAMGASLYYSEYVGFIPCEFCWYQRIALYPLAVLLAVAVASRSRLQSRYVITMAVIGLALSTYHYQLQVFPEQGGVCSQGVSCAGKYVNEFGFVSIPFMAGCGFVTVLLLELAERRARLVRAAFGEE